MTKKNDTFLSHITNIFWKFFKALTIFLAYQSGVGAVPLMFSSSNSLRKSPEMAHGGTIKYADENGSALKIMTSDFCVQAALNGPLGCHRIVNDTPMKQTVGGVAAVTRIDALSVRPIFKNKVTADAVYICQTEGTFPVEKGGLSFLYNLPSTICRTYSAKLFKTCQTDANTNGLEEKFEHPKISRDVTLGDPDLIRRQNR